MKREKKKLCGKRVMINMDDVGHDDLYIMFCVLNYEGLSCNNITYLNYLLNL